jgi:hypothetical protein
LVAAIAARFRVHDICPRPSNAPPTATGDENADYAVIAEVEFRAATMFQMAATN